MWRESLDFLHAFSFPSLPPFSSLVVAHWSNVSFKTTETLKTKQKKPRILKVPEWLIATRGQMAVFAYSTFNVDRLLMSFRFLFYCTSFCCCCCCWYLSLVYFTVRLQSDITETETSLCPLCLYSVRYSVLYIVIYGLNKIPILFIDLFRKINSNAFLYIMM